mmetsp:Transcript_106235/g.288290  ORF Transcript_106235/g.288290 Transcript_106235/m.288290 type:complete len:92 (-) Transcript_106235:9-284(-)
MPRPCEREGVSCGGWAGNEGKRAKVAAAAGSQVLKRSLSCGISDALRSESTSQPASGLMHSLRAAMLSVRATLFGHHAHLKICTVVVSRIL